MPGPERFSLPETPEPEWDSNAPNADTLVDTSLYGEDSPQEQPTDREVQEVVDNALSSAFDVLDLYIAQWREPTDQRQPDQQGPTTRDTGPTRGDTFDSSIQELEEAIRMARDSINRRRTYQSQQGQQGPTAATRDMRPTRGNNDQAQRQATERRNRINRWFRNS